MPELPEVETILRGIKPQIQHQCVTNVIIRQPQLRWLVPKKIVKALKGQKIHDITRLGKYLLFHTTAGTAILHFGMSGYVRIIDAQQIPPKKHDHFDIIFKSGICLRYNDTRRFGALLWTEDPPNKHKLLVHLGPEPLSDELSSDYLLQQSHHKKITIKQFLMDSHIVVGVGNIYATEALYAAHIHPQRPANTLSKAEYERLVQSVKEILAFAIQQGGTTLKDFQNSDGKPGYFKQQLKAYGRAGLNCVNCQNTLESIHIQQRNTVHCGHCQH